MGAAVKISQTAGVSVSPANLGAALAGQRERFLNTFASFTAEEWSAPTRCHEWEAHTTFRHLADTAEAHLAGYTGEPLAFGAAMEQFDPKTTPDLWLAHSSRETPPETLTRYERASGAIAGHAEAELASRSDRTSAGPYGETHWSVIPVHVLWDGWLHERDILAGTGAVPPIADHPVERNLVALYGILMSTVPPLQLGEPLTGTIQLEDSGAALCAHFGGSDDHVVVEQIEPTATADVRGDLLPVLDALAGRGAPLADVLVGDQALITRMAYLAAFI